MAKHPHLGDNKVVMSSLLPRFAGKINLIYIDPPFATGQDFSFRVRVGDEEFVKEPSIIEQKAYRDTWGRGLDSYLQMMFERLTLIRELVADDGTIYIHMDWKMSHHVKLLSDEVFGDSNFRNEVIWHYQQGTAPANDFKRKHETLLRYSKGPEPAFTMPPVAPVNPERYDKLDDAGRRYFVRGTGKICYMDEGRKCDDVWSWLEDKRMCQINSVANERIGFPTQKPEAVLERVVRASSNKGDLVADFFCGSGTTGAVAEKLGRRWIMCDLSKWAIQVTRKRLLQIEGFKPLEILNLGNYERHKLAANGLAGWERYVKFILDLYRAEPVSGFKMLHGKKARASVHVGSVDSPITMREIRETLKEAKESGIREVHFLGWDFEMGLHDLTKEIEEDYGVKPRLISIPKEALEVKDAAKEQIRFFDLNYLEFAHDLKGKKLTVTIKDFIIANPEYVPDEVRDKIRKFTDYIDYWAVDWDYHDDTFHNGWQCFRTRKNPRLETKAVHTYNECRNYKVLVKVVDIFGNDTTKLLEAKVS